MREAYTLSKENVFIRFYKAIVAKVPWYVWWILPGLILLIAVTMPPFIWIIWMTFYKIILS